MKIIAPLTAILASLFPALLPAQERPPTFTEEVEVRVMDLDVVVTDKSGRPIPDLKREDFTVRLGGKTVPIDYFARIDEGTIHAPDLATASPDQVLAAYRRGDEAYVPRHFLMYVDIGDLAPDGRKRGLEALRDLVTRMGPDDTGRVLLFDRRSKELSEWTSSKEQLFAAFTKIEEGRVGMSRLLTRGQTLRDIDSRSCEFTARLSAEQQRVEVRRMLKDVGSELATLSPLAGKKAVLLVSGGFEFQPGLAMTSYARNMSAELEQIVRRANAAEITFYTLDARGLDPGVSFRALEDSQWGMTLLARETGGLALLNSNDLKRGVSRIYQDASVYYSIGVTLTKVPSASYQDVRVEVNRPGIAVRTRRGYAVRTEADRARDRVQATLKTNLSYAGILMTLRTAPATKRGGRYTVPISVTLPASALTFLPEGAVRRATAEVSIGAIDDARRMSDVATEEATFTLPEGKEEEPLTYTATLLTRKGNQRIVVNLRDRASGRMGTAKVDVRVE